MTPTKGKGAVLSGRQLQDFIAGVLCKRDYLFVPSVRFFPSRELEQPVFTRQCETGKDIYRKKRCVDFILHHPKLWPECLVIQSIWQKSRGSVHEKYPHEVLSISQNIFDTIIVLDGGGYPDGAKQWLVDQAGKTRLRHVFDRYEFSNFADRRKL